MKQRPSLSRRNFAALLAATPVAATALEAQQQPAGAPNPNTSLQPEQKQYPQKFSFLGIRLGVNFVIYTMTH